MSSLSQIAVLTSGGDAPGMNVAIRSVVRTAISKNIKVVGIQSGYEGIISHNFKSMNLRSVANIIQRGGTILKTNRFLDFHSKEVRKKAAEILRQERIDALVCIGGDGTLRAAELLSSEQDIKVMGLPATIDNDIEGTDFTLGFDTALNTALEAIDRIRDTAHSHNRIFIVEVMGRTSSFIALNVGLAAGAEDVLTLESQNLEKTIQKLKEAYKKGKKASIIIVAEGEKPGRAYEISDKLKQLNQFDSRICVLGHIQRGGSPTAWDRILGSRMGAFAVESLLKNEHGVFTGIQNNNMVLHSIKEKIEKKKASPKHFLSLIHTLAN